MKRLAVNADDFGFTPGVTAGILRAMQGGVVTGTTAMVCVDGAVERTLESAAAVPGRVGVHLQLTDGAPCLPPSEVPTLCGPDGRFPRSWRELSSEIDTEQVRREWTAQVQRLLDRGLRPSHLDSHHSVHMNPRCTRAYVAVARHFDLPVRGGDARLARHFKARGVRCADACEMGWKGEPDVDVLLDLLRGAFAQLGDDATIELMCHPAMVDDDLKARSSHTDSRESELAVLCSPALADGLRSLDVQLVLPSEV
ncbi:MAG: carbohydrate deacetylase [Armatimonadetes bacterium]|nr:carbohydrate deacetylase [Armatimonadota bacterium]